MSDESDVDVEEKDDKRIEWKKATSVYDFSATDIDGQESNYEQMKALHTRFAAQGFVTLAFPSNQFMGQEPGSNADIKRFITNQFGGTEFVDLFSKTKVNGSKAHPLYKWLKSQLHGTLGDAIKWNFSKFLIDRSGQPVKRYSPTTKPKEIEDDILRHLDANST